jgi:hypothetical protein
MDCKFCGNPTSLMIGDMPICENCYNNAGSCCREFGDDDLWRDAKGEPSCPASATVQDPDRKPSADEKKMN